MSKRLTTEEFIIRAKTVHGDRYDYSNVDYKGGRKNVNIICRLHGEFKQSPFNHIFQRSNCPECVGKKRLTTEIFIKMAKEIHGEKYNYNKSICNGGHKKVIIICNIHGAFFQTPNCHIYKKNGCPKCAGRQKLTTREFIQKAQSIHGRKYDYSKSKYNGSHVKVAVICPVHGEFWPTPLNHIASKSGCPKCEDSKGELFIARILEKNKINYIREKTFNDCRDIRKLKFDFYLPDRGMLIEYNGDQHYRYNTHWHQNEKTLESQQIRDAIKRKYAIKHGFEFLVIKYNDKDIEQILQKAVA